MNDDMRYIATASQNLPVALRPAYYALCAPKLIADTTKTAARNALYRTANKMTTIANKI